MSLLTIALMVALVAGVLPLPVLFMIAFAVALVVNYPDDGGAEGTARRSRGERAGGRVGDLRGGHSHRHPVRHEDDRRDGSTASSRSCRASLGPHMAIVTGLLSIPFTFFLSNDAFYFGVLPILESGGGDVRHLGGGDGAGVGDRPAGASC